MPTDARLHLFKARSIDARISKDEPKIARLSVMLANGDFWSIEIPRHVLERLIVRGRRALDEAPLPPRLRPAAGRSATSRNK
jgi:hypothetical protein